MGDPRGQEADARQLLTTDHLAGAELHLPVQIVTDFLEPLRHVVERSGQFRHLVARIELEPEAEITRCHPPRPVAEQTQRPKHPAVAESAECRQERRGRQGRGPGRDDQRAIAAADFARKVVEALLQKRGQRG